MKLLGALQAMNAVRIYFDTNPIIYAVEGFAGYDVEIEAVLVRAVKGEFAGITSEISLAECLVKPIADGDRELQAIYEHTLQGTGTLSAVPVSRSVLREAARLRAFHKSLRLPDAVHAATARLERCDAFITNDAGLKSVTGLNVVVLKELLDLTP